MNKIKLNQKIKLRGAPIIIFIAYSKKKTTTDKQTDKQTIYIYTYIYIYIYTYILVAVSPYTCDSIYYFQIDPT